MLRNGGAETDQGVIFAGAKTSFRNSSSIAFLPRHRCLCRSNDLNASQQTVRKGGGALDIDALPTSRNPRRSRLAGLHK